MPSASLVLFIDLEPNTRIDLRVAARAALAWADLVEEVGFHFDPLNAPKIELESSKPGSQKLKTIVSAITDDCPSSYKMGHQSGLSIGGSGSFAWLIMPPVFDVASVAVGLSVS